MKRQRPRRHHGDAASMALYDKAAQEASAQVIARFSTSFGVGTRMLPAPMRRHIESVYALVRVADEIVDTYRGPDAGDVLDSLEADVAAALEHGYSANLVVHAFAVTANEVGIGQAQSAPFFESMRMDLTQTEHDQASFERYVFGSAEVVGEMCAAVFLNTGRGPRPLPVEVRDGARRLGAAYQKINFLRDLAMDDEQLGRHYFPGITAQTLTDAELAVLVDDARADIVAAEATLPGLPRKARVGVETTIDIYTRLLNTIAQTPASALVRRRVRVSNPRKILFAARNSCPLTAPRRRTA